MGIKSITSKLDKEKKKIRKKSKEITKRIAKRITKKKKKENQMEEVSPNISIINTKNIKTSGHNTVSD